MFGPKSPGAEESSAWFRCQSCGEISRLRGRDALLRVCASCGHHAPLSAREWVMLLCDGGSFEERFSELRSADPQRFRGKVRYRDELKAARKASGVAESVLVGEARVGGAKTIVVASEVAFLQGKLGAAGGEAIARAFELANREKTHIVLALSSGGFRRQDGPYAAAVLPRVVAELAALRRAGLASIVIASGLLEGAAAVLASLADICWPEPGTRIVWNGPAAGGGAEPRGGTRPVGSSVVPRSQQRERLLALVDALGRR